MKMLKKELADLRSYFQELGFSYEAVKVNDQEDFIVRRPFGADSLQYIQESKGEKKEGDEVK